MNTYLLTDRNLTFELARSDRSRDHEMVATLARHGLLTMPLLMRAMRTGRTVTYRRFARLFAAGLVERTSVPGIGGLLRATREGQRYVGLGALPLALVRPGGAVHGLCCAELALRLEGEDMKEDALLLTERELSFAERVEGRPIAGARIDAHGREGMHRPDLAIVSSREVIAVEVELSIKAPRRLASIMRAWRRAENVDRVEYRCGSAGVRRAVERAVAATYAEQKVRIGELAR
jgi:hypothetical protein